MCQNLFLFIITIENYNVIEDYHNSVLVYSILTLEVLLGTIAQKVFAVSQIKNHVKRTYM